MSNKRRTFSSRIILIIIGVILFPIFLSCSDGSRLTITGIFVDNGTMMISIDDQIYENRNSEWVSVVRAPDKIKSVSNVGWFLVGQTVYANNNGKIEKIDSIDNNIPVSEIFGLLRFITANENIYEKIDNSYVLYKKAPGKISGISYYDGICVSVENIIYREENNEWMEFIKLPEEITSFSISRSGIFIALHEKIYKYENDSLILINTLKSELLLSNNQTTFNEKSVTIKTINESISCEGFVAGKDWEPNPKFDLFDHMVFIKFVNKSGKDIKAFKGKAFVLDDFKEIKYEKNVQMDSDLSFPTAEGKIPFTFKKDQVIYFISATVFGAPNMFYGCDEYIYNKFIAENKIKAIDTTSWNQAYSINSIIFSDGTIMN